VSDESHRLVIYPSRLKGILVLMGALALIAGAVAIAAFREEMGVGLALSALVIYVGIPFFSAGAVYALYRLIVTRPAVVVDDEGITDNASAMGVGFIAWDEIERIAVYKFNGQSMLGIHPKDLSAVLARQGWLKRNLIRTNGWLGCAPINIPQVVLPIKVDELATRMAHSFAAHGQIDCNVR
jgi:hypothetical protein